MKPRGTLERRQFLLACGAAGLFATPSASRAAEREARPVLPVLIAEGARLAYVEPLLDLVAKGGGFDWAPIHVPWPRLMVMLTNGEALAWGVSKTPEREQFLDFSRTVLTRNVWLIAPAGQQQAAPTLAALKGRTLCKRRGFTLDSPLNEAMRDKLFQVVEADLDYDAVLRMMLAGRCDGVLFTHRTLDPAVVEQRLEQLAPPANRFVVQRPPINSGGIYFAAAKKRPEAARQLQLVNEGLRAQAPAIRELLATDA